MLETIMSGMCLASISGLTFLAYKHPPAYEKIAVKLMVVFFSVIIVAIAVAGTLGYLIVDHLTDGTLEVGEAVRQSAIDELLYLRSVLYWSGLTIVISIASMMYLGFLGFLPSLLTEDEPNKKK